MMTDEQKYIQLGWRIMELKLMYYLPELVHKSWHQHLTLTDHQYDVIENDYVTLCNKLGKEPTASNMVEFDINRSSARLVLSKYGHPKPKKKLKRS